MDKFWLRMCIGEPNIWWGQYIFETIIVMWSHFQKFKVRGIRFEVESQKGYGNDMIHALLGKSWERDNLVVVNPMLITNHYVLIFSI